MGRFHHIVVPVDFEEPSQQALQVAIDLALTFDAKLTLVHAWDISTFAYAGSSSFVTADLWTPIANAAEAQLESSLAVVRKRLPKAESILAQGAPAVEVVAAANRVGADLIVMGTHGRQGLGRVFLGSVAEKVVRSSTVPVLTIRGNVPLSA
jgi:nucleotide-binding universal stress UspA family protein